MKDENGGDHDHLAFSSPAPGPSVELAVRVCAVVVGRRTDVIAGADLVGMYQPRTSAAPPTPQR